MCTDVRREPMLNRTEKISPEARLDVSSIAFWTPGQRALRVFDLNVEDTGVWSSINVSSETKMRRKDITVNMSLMWRMIHSHLWYLPP